MMGSAILVRRGTETKALFLLCEDTKKRTVICKPERDTLLGILNLPKPSLGFSFQN